MKQTKDLKDLNMMDAFLFDASMEDEENAKMIAGIIIERATGRKIKNFTVETQKELKNVETGKRGIRMDVLVRNKKTANKIKEVYNIEPNNYYEKDIEKRTRYYNSIMDVKFLKSREKFEKLPDLIAIWILPYDPFGDNRILYTVKNMVVENNQLVYNDGVTNIFLYTDGEVGGSEGLKSLLKFMKHTVRNNAVDPELEQVQDIVDCIKNDEKVGERYMTMQEMIDYEKRDSYEEGVNDGISQSTLDFLKDVGDVTEALEKTIYEEKDIEVLKKWNKLSAKVSSVEEFMEKMYM